VFLQNLYNFILKYNGFTKYKPKSTKIVVMVHVCHANIIVVAMVGVVIIVAVAVAVVAVV